MTLEEVVKRRLHKDLVFIHSLSRDDLFNAKFKELLFSKDIRTRGRLSLKAYNKGLVYIENDCGDDINKVRSLLDEFESMCG